jgi:hypothetical protein
MGFKKHLTLKCHTCTRKLVQGGTKKSGSYSAFGWKLVAIKNGHYVMLCPVCVKTKKLTKN